MYIKIDQGDLLRAQTLLLGIKNGYPKVVSRAINKTTGPTVTLAKKKIYEKYYITQKKYIVDSIKKTKATVSAPRAQVYFSSARLPLIAFRTKRGVSAGGTFVQIERSGGMKLLKHAFIATMKNGKKGVFTRMYSGDRTKYIPRWKKRYGKLPKKYRLKIRQMFSVDASDMMQADGEKILREVQDASADRYQARFMHELDYVLGKL